MKITPSSTVAIDIGGGCELLATAVAIKSTCASVATSYIEEPSCSTWFLLSNVACSYRT